MINTQFVAGHINQVHTKSKNAGLGMVKSLVQYVTGLNQEGIIAWVNQVLKSFSTAEDITPSSLSALTNATSTKLETEKLKTEMDIFSQTVSHEFRLPLSTIVTASEFVRGYHTNMSPETLQSSLDTIAQTGRQMVDMLEEILLLSELSHAEVELVPLDMAEIIAEALHRLDGKIQKHQATFNLPETWPTVLGYRPWVVDVWVNYLSNALKYGRQPSQLWLGFTADADNNQIRFWVGDNGPGISPEQQSQLFSPFVRLNTDQAEGHGLGLSIVRRIVERLGGEVGVESTGTVGQGSIFSFTLPDVEPQQNPQL